MGIKRVSLLLFMLLGMFSCEYHFPEDNEYADANLGNLNTDNFVVVGDDFLAGVMDGALYSAGQQNSIGALLAGQFSIIDGSSFLQPDINSENGYHLYVDQGSSPYGKWIYKYMTNTDEDPWRIYTSGESVAEYVGEKDSVRNLAFPGLKVANLGDESIHQNTFYNRIFSDGEGELDDQVVNSNPEFVLCWLGQNDFLNYAIKGATEDSELTSVSDFENKYTELIDNLMEKTNCQLLLINLISFGDLPFFYLRQYNFIKMENAEKNIAQAVYSNFNKGVSAYNVGKPTSEMRPYVGFEDNGSTLYPQPVVIIDDELIDATYSNGEPLEKYRQLTEGEMALYSITEEMVDAGYGSSIPLSEQYYLKTDIIFELEERVAAFNQILTNLQQAYPDRIVLFDLAGKIQEIAKTGRTDAWGIAESEDVQYIDGVPLNGDTGMNSIFSIDGIHFNQRGNAYVVNQIINKLNNTYNANIPTLDVNNYLGNTYY